MTTTLLFGEGPVRELPDPNAIPFPDGPLWDRLGHELIYGREPEDVAREYGEPVQEVERLSDLFWDGYGRSRWLGEAAEYGLLDELVALRGGELYARLLKERAARGLED